MAVPAKAQGTLGAGVSFLLPGNDAGTYTGFQVDYAVPVYTMGTTTVSGVGDFSFNRSGENDESVMLVQGGARVTGAGGARVKPFGQAVLGAFRISDDEAGDTSFVFTPGGGVDIPLNGRTNLRAQIDFPIIFFEGETEGTTRVFLGASWMLGQ